MLVSRLKFLRLTAVWLALAPVLPVPAMADVLKPVERWRVEPSLADEDEAGNLSGAVCYAAGGRRLSCLLVGDEVRHARFFALGDKLIAPDRRTLALVPKREADGSKIKESDAEGVASDAEGYYIVGSHGLNKKGVRQTSRYLVHRVAVSPATGLPDDFGTADRPPASVTSSDVVARVIEKAAFLKPHLGLIPGMNGVNVEGVAIRDGAMFFGFRGPVLKEGAVVMALAKAAVFGGAAPDPRTGGSTSAPGRASATSRRWRAVSSCSPDPRRRSRARPKSSSGRRTARPSGWPRSNRRWTRT